MIPLITGVSMFPQMLQSERTQSMKSLQDSMGQLMQENSELKRKLSRLLKRVSVNPFERPSAKPQVHSQPPSPPLTRKIPVGRISIGKRLIWLTD